MAQSRRLATVLLVRTVMISFNTHCVGLVSVGAGSSEFGLGDGGDDVGDCTGVGVGVWGEVLGDAGGGVHVTGVLAEGVCFLILLLITTGTGVLSIFQALEYCCGFTFNGAVISLIRFSESPASQHQSPPSGQHVGDIFQYPQ